MPPANPYALPAGTDIGGFQIVGVLGAGGFGITYEAISPRIGRRWAIKEFFPQGLASREGATRVVYSEGESDTIARALDQFERSTRKLCALDHPSIVRVFHYIEANATGYMVMDYVEGRTLESWLRERPSSPPLSELRPIVEKIFDALDYAHACNTVHRDIAPDNILIRNDGNPILIDFGALKEINLQTTTRLSSLLVSKKHYSPPEHAQHGSEARPAMDVYSLGAVLYRAITGAPPVDADDRTYAIAQGESDPYVPLGASRDLALPRATLHAIDRALSFRSPDRPQTMRAFRDSLGWEEAAAVTVPATQAVPNGGQVVEPRAVSGGANRRRAMALGLFVTLVAMAGAGAFVLAPRGPQPGQEKAATNVDAPNPCSIERLQTATAGGEQGLREFLRGCTSGQQHIEARSRLDARIDERENALARDAGFDIDKLQAYLASCTRCTARPDVQLRQALVKAEEATYRAAKGSIERLEAYAKQCKACLHRDDALRSAGALRQVELQRVKADNSAYQAAKGSIERLETYAKSCDLCRHRDEALREASALRQAARAKADKDAYDAARGSIERLESYVKTCDLCRYQKEAMSEADKLRKQVADTTNGPDLRRRIMNFIEWEHFQNRIDHFAEKVDFFGRGVVSRDVVLKEIAAHRRAWPIQNYLLTPGTLEIVAIGRDQYAVSFSFTFHKINGPRSVKGSARSQIILMDRGGRFYLTSAKETVQRQ